MTYGHTDNGDFDTKSPFFVAVIVGLEESVKKTAVDFCCFSDWPKPCEMQNKDKTICIEQGKQSTEDERQPKKSRQILSAFFVLKLQINCAKP